MSVDETTDQADLDQFKTALEIRDEPVDEKPSWAPLPDEDDDEHHPEDCLNCGDPVTLQFRRVFGSNQNRVDGCPNCKTYREIADGGALPDGGSR